MLYAQHLSADLCLVMTPLQGTELIMHLHGLNIESVNYVTDKKVVISHIPSQKHICYKKGTSQKLQVSVTYVKTAIYLSKVSSSC